ncbi:hypothetical protein DMB92_09140, partial [Campylobacter sp. MIT 99-7217]
EALSLLENIKGEALPAKLSEEEFLKNGFSEVINKENFLKHLKGKEDSKTRLSFLNLVEPTLKSWDIRLGLEHERSEYIKTFVKNDKSLYYVLITQDNDKLFVTGLPKSRLKSLKSDINKALEVEFKSPLPTQALSDMGTELKTLETHNNNSNTKEGKSKEAEYIKARDLEGISSAHSQSKPSTARNNFAKKT